MLRSLFARTAKSESRKYRLRGALRGLLIGSFVSNVHAVNAEKCTWNVRMHFLHRSKFWLSRKQKKSNYLPNFAYNNKKLTFLVFCSIKFHHNNIFYLNFSKNALCFVIYDLQSNPQRRWNLFSLRFCINSFRFQQLREFIVDFFYYDHLHIRNQFHVSHATLIAY